MGFLHPTHHILYDEPVACPQGHSETQRSLGNVGFRSLTQPTPVLVFAA